MDTGVKRSSISSMSTFGGGLGRAILEIITEGTEYSRALTLWRKLLRE